MNISSHRISNGLKRAARALLLAYALLLALVMWASESMDRRQTTFQRDCYAAGGFITWSDGTTSCTRIRSGGMLQL